MKKNLLIVDDENDLAQSLKDLLEDVTEKIFIANNGVEGLKILLAHKIDCVITDIKMPEMDGIEFMKEARVQGFTIPFIFYTGHGSRELKKNLEELGALDLLVKPNFLKLELRIKEIFTDRA